MLVNKIERKFELNISSEDEISKMCPDEDFSKIGELFNGSPSSVFHNIIAMAVIMNRGYEDHKQYDDPEYHPVYMTAGDCKFMKIAELKALEMEVLESIKRDSAVTVETETEKKTLETDDSADTAKRSE